MAKLLIILLLLNFTAAAQQKISWPRHKKAVIVLTYDDALESQLQTAIPQLDSVHLTGTFFLTGIINYKTIPRWRAVAKKGHELANHTIYHPCFTIPLKDNPTANDGYTVGSLLHEIEEMNSFLFAIDNKTERTYAYPCTETEVKGVKYVDSLRKSGMVKYARLGGDDNAIVTDFKKLDYLQVPAWGLDGNNKGIELINYVKKVEKSAGMGIFMFHGIGGDYITTSAKAHKELLNYLAKNKATIWVTTFQQAMDYISKANK